MEGKERGRGRRKGKERKGKKGKGKEGKERERKGREGKRKKGKGREGTPQKRKVGDYQGREKKEHRKLRRNFLERREETVRQENWGNNLGRERILGRKDK